MKFLVCLLILGFLLTPTTFAKMPPLPNDEQLHNLFVQVWMSIDNDIHNFYYGIIQKFDDKGMWIRVGDRDILYPKDEILNFHDARKKWKILKERND